MIENKSSIQPGPPSQQSRSLPRPSTYGYPLLLVNRVINPAPSKVLAHREGFDPPYAWDHLIPYPRCASD